MNVSENETLLLRVKVLLNPVPFHLQNGRAKNKVANKQAQNSKIWNVPSETASQFCGVRMTILKGFFVVQP